MGTAKRTFGDVGGGPRVRAGAVAPAEMALVTAALVGVAAAAYGPYVATGWMTYDDWHFVAVHRYAGGGGLVSGFSALLESPGFGFRPGLAVVMAVWASVVGTNGGLALGIGIALSVAVAALLHAVLRAVGVRPVAAAATAALFLLFPWCDSIRFWPTASLNCVALLLLLGGLLVSLRAFAARPRRAWLLHGAGPALYAASILTYEVTVVAVALAGGAYLLVAPARRAATRWLADLAVAGVTGLAAALGTERGVASVGALAGTVRGTVRQGGELLGLAVVPPAPVAGLAVLACLVAATVAARRAGAPRWRPGGLHSPLVGVAAGAAIVAAGYVPLLPAGHLFPLGEGVDNRGNLLAAIGFACVTVATVLLLRDLLAALPRAARWATPAAAVCGLAVAVAYADRLRDSGDRWRRAAAEQERVVATVRAALPQPGAGTAVYTFGHAAWQAPGIPIFSAWWDLRGALQLAYDDGSLDGIPVRRGFRWRCTDTEVRAVPPEDPGPTGARARLGAAVFVDARSGRAERVTTRAACRRLTAQLRPGPAYREPGSRASGGGRRDRHHARR